MSALPAGLAAHLARGATTLCRAWAVTRRDGVRLGFTDHDQALEFDGLVFAADSGITARVLQQTTGLSVDNSEAYGALTSGRIAEADILAGRYDGAAVEAWLVDWAAPENRVRQFRGTIGEVTRRGAAFEADLRGLAEALNRPQGRVYQRACGAVLGDGACRVDLGRAGFFHEGPLAAVTEERILTFAGVAGFDAGWFEGGLARVLDGPSAGLSFLVKADRAEGAGRRIELWEAPVPGLAAGARVRILAGCDKRAETCRLKFNNFLNFRGFPHVPGEDWLMSYPVRSGQNDGGSREAGA